VIPLAEQHLRNLISEFLAHYHGERNHQGLANRLIEPLVANTNSGKGVIRRRERLGGVLNYYYREAAKFAVDRVFAHFGLQRAATGKFHAKNSCIRDRRQAANHTSKEKGKKNEQAVDV
jgi:hypothetical protein